MTRILIRCDASLSIGSGHVMRCLTLARELQRQETEVLFLCRRQAGDLIALLEQEFLVLTLPQRVDPGHEGLQGRNLYQSWLGCSQEQDAAECLEVLGAAGINSASWLVADHYGLDACWETRMIKALTCWSTSTKLLVIDDLADRPHICNMLLDQNMVNDINTRYQGRLPTDCRCLLGPSYSLLRPEFNQLRPASLARRTSPKFERLLVFLGGSDAENETSKVIEGIRLTNRNWQHVDVVVGQAFPSKETLKRIIDNVAWAELHVQTSKMAELMSKADLAITAGGSITWEKCALGLPSLTVIEGDNQESIVTKMDEMGVLQNLGRASKLTPKDYATHLDQTQLRDLGIMSARASSICDGTGVLNTALAIYSEAW